MSLPTDARFARMHNEYLDPERCFHAEDEFSDGTPTGVYDQPPSEAPEPYPADAPLDSYAVENLVDDIEFDVPNPEQ